LPKYEDESKRRLAEKSEIVRNIRGESQNWIIMKISFK
jgi:hypothetical protein